jgi:ribosome-binding protein aMBF1 (putative translation factor)
VNTVVDALIKHFETRVEKARELGGDYKQAQLAEEMEVEQPLLSRWLNRKAKPRGRNFTHIVTYLQSVRRLPAQPA